VPRFVRSGDLRSQGTSVTPVTKSAVSSRVTVVAHSALQSLSLEQIVVGGAITVGPLETAFRGEWAACNTHVRMA